MNASPPEPSNVQEPGWAPRTSMETIEPPLRDELFSVDLLQRHARQLAQQHRVAVRKGQDRLLPRLAANEKILRAYNDSTLRVEKSRRITPAAEWLLDNFYLIEEQILKARRHLPRGFGRELPYLTSGPAAGYPRVHDLAWALISHVDGRIDAAHLMSFIAAYQETTPLKLGELWAIPIMLRLGLIENLRRVAVLLAADRRDRDRAIFWADRMRTVAENEPTKLVIAVADLAKSNQKLSHAFVTEFWQHMQKTSPKTKLVLGWIEEQLGEQGTTIEQMVHSESQSQAANQVSVGNSITSLRFLDATDWREFVETLSVVEQTLRSDPSGVYGDMDFATRDAYRHEVERIAKGSSMPEWEVAQAAVNLAHDVAGNGGGRGAHVGHYLVGKGSKDLEKLAGLRPPFPSRWLRPLQQAPLLGYLGSLAAITAGVTYTVLPWPSGTLATWALLGLGTLIAMGASQLAVALVNWFVTLVARPRLLPRLDYSKGIPPECRTMVVVPTMLTSAEGIRHLLEGMEVCYLANRDANVRFALLTDFRDGAEEQLPADGDLLALVRAGIEDLNLKYEPDQPGIFYLFHRPRRWNERDRRWMGYERKRGKLEDFNALLRGHRRECFSVIVGDLAALPHIKYVITLDTDTQLPRDAARQLVGTMAHPLNRPVHEPGSGHVVEGYSILQPRVAVNLPSTERSRFAALFSGDPGIDPYTRAVSDVYQDIFQEGSFIGKGIYDVDAFDQAVGGRFPANRILSHDLLEGSYARSALVTDVLLFEEFPAFYTTDAQRRQRWMRGDWQIAAWVMPRVPGPEGRTVPNPLSLVSRWKIFDNLRRCLVPPALVALLVLGWTVFQDSGSLWTLLVVAILFALTILATITALLRKPAELPWSLHGRNVAPTMRIQFSQAAFTLIFLPHDAVLSLDATLRTLGRLWFTRRNLLEWQTACDAERKASTALTHYWAAMWTAPGLAVAIGLTLMWWHPVSLLWAAPLLLLWMLAPVAAWWLSQPLAQPRPVLSHAQTWFLRGVARRTWRFFETFMGPDENWLPPDNFQEYPRPIVASRTSPTNIGIGMLGTLTAWDFGYVSTPQLAERIGKTLQTLEQLERYQGHFLNWYDTRTLQPLNPRYVSTVDNGNLAGFLLTLRSGLLELAQHPGPASTACEGLGDTLRELRNALRRSETRMSGLHAAALDGLERKLADSPTSPAAGFSLLKHAQEILAKLSEAIASTADKESVWWLRALEQQCHEHRQDFEAAFPWLTLADQFDALAEATDAESLALSRIWAQLNAGPSPGCHAQVLVQLKQVSDTSQRGGLADRLMEGIEAALGEAGLRTTVLESHARRCEELALMDFSLLYDPSRMLFSIGYNVTTHRLDGSYYDLLASEARLASFVAIALGQVSQEHWFALGRLLTSVDGRRALISWSGSMFEYLMPLLVMPNHEQTLLGQAYHSSVRRQINYGRQLGVPWGISESGYNLMDAHSNYQYRAFGVPGLGFKRGLADDLVIAPYATALALMVAPKEACRNLERLRELGAEGRYGFHEALDYTPSRLPREKDHALVQSYMAHHQGMALLALAYQLLDRPMQRRFQANPSLRSAELLLQERIPKEMVLLYPHEWESQRTRAAEAIPEATYRAFTNPNGVVPEVHLLSNGRYHVMVTNAGGGYSVWNDTALTRWREDTTRDCWGMFTYLRDAETGSFWSTAHQPTVQPATSYEAVFSQGRAEFRLRAHELDAHTEIAVSPEDDVEVRRVTLTNQSDRPRTIEVTSFAEVVLNTVGADQAHPAFNKLFIQTELRRPASAILCSRRRRARGEQPPWLFHLMLMRGTEVGAPSFETDRAKFLGRGGNAISPAALTSPGALSNSEGSVLDPALAIRRTVRIAPRESACLTFVTGGSASRESLLSLVEKYQDQSIADRVFELAWTHGLVTLRHLNATEAQAQLFGRLASALLYSQKSRRAAESVLKQNRRGQRNLWSYGISGDLPIVLVRATRLEQIELVRELLSAHAYWRLKGLTVDLVILNEDVSVYRQSIHDQIMSLIAAGIEAHMLDKSGGIFVRRTDQLSSEDLVLLQAVARIVLTDENGTLAEQLQRRVRPEPAMPALVPERVRESAPAPGELPQRELLFFNGLGGFSPDGREYVITVKAGQTSPAPWVNVIANPSFGTLISEGGGSYTWAENCHEFRLTPWHNDPVTDVSGEAFYIRDERGGHFWSPTPMPARGRTPYVVRHGFGYTVFEHAEDGIESELWIYVAADAPVKFAHLNLRNVSGRERSLSVTGYWEWVLGELRQRNSMHVVTELEPKSGAILAHNPYNSDFVGRTVFVSATEPIRSYTCDRTEFIGRNGSLASPAALRRTKLAGKSGATLDACTALQTQFLLQPGEKREVIFKVGAGLERDAALALLQTYRRADACHEARNVVRAHWREVLGAVQVETPDAALNVLANGWLLYQTISCRLWARTGYYQSGGAFGFRDQLQDSMALVHARPVWLREQLLRAAAHQFPEGDVQHWWHPPTNRGVRTHFSDDYLWLPYVLCHYVETIGDTGVLNERVPFVDGRTLRPEEESYYDAPRQSGETGTLYEHCVRAIKYGLKFGEHGLPLIGCGDWNDGMNLVGEHGKGESVWLAFFLGDVLLRFSALAKGQDDLPFAQHCEEQARLLRANIERTAWDGEWYRRAYFDTGEPLGSASNVECQIDSLPQSWAAITGGADADRTRMAMKAVDQRLVRRDQGLIQLFDPPFDTSSLEPGYIKGYVPGVRENGGQYTHAAIWTVMAFAKIGDTRRAWELFKLINPVLHASTTEGLARYKAEPYVVAADVYSLPPHTGRGGWTWYTGSAGWMYRLITESLLGLRLEAGKLHLAPLLPADWKSMSLSYRWRETSHAISLTSATGAWQGPPKVLMDGVEQPESVLALQSDRREHKVEMRFN